MGITSDHQRMASLPLLHRPGYLENQYESTLLSQKKLCNINTIHMIASDSTLQKAPLPVYVHQDITD